MMQKFYSYFNERGAKSSDLTLLTPRPDQTTEPPSFSELLFPPEVESTAGAGQTTGVLESSGAAEAALALENEGVTLNDNPPGTILAQMGLSPSQPGKINNPAVETHAASVETHDPTDSDNSASYHSLNDATVIKKSEQDPSSDDPPVVEDESIIKGKVDGNGSGEDNNSSPLGRSKYLSHIDKQRRINEAKLKNQNPDPAFHAQLDKQRRIGRERQNFLYPNGDKYGEIWYGSGSRDNSPVQGLIDSYEATTSELDELFTPVNRHKKRSANFSSSPELDITKEKQKKKKQKQLAGVKQNIYNVLSSKLLRDTLEAEEDGEDDSTSSKDEETSAPEASGEDSNDDDCDATIHELEVPPGSSS